MGAIDRRFNPQGYSESTHIADVRLDGAGRVWTDYCD